MRGATNRPVVVTGCQRSGTTLLHLILDSHPQIRGVDEADYSDAMRDAYLESPDYGPVVSFKLPRVASNPAFIEALPDARTIWCVRDPRDVVTSMLRLRLPLQGGEPVSWAAHPHGAEYELSLGLKVLDGSAPPAGWAVPARRFRRLRRTAPVERSRDDQLFLAAFCWRVKNDLYFRNRERLSMHLLRYESLVSDPETEMRAVLRTIGVEWSDRVLRHHRLHQGISIGETDNTRPIDAANTGKWAAELSPAEMQTVAALCSETAARFGYSMNGA